MLERTRLEIECGKRQLRINAVKAFNDDSYGGSFPELRKALGNAKCSTVIVGDDDQGMSVKLSVVAADGEIMEFLEPIAEFPSSTLLVQVMLIV